MFDALFFMLKNRGSPVGAPPGKHGSIDNKPVHPPFLPRLHDRRHDAGETIFLRFSETLDTAAEAGDADFPCGFIARQPGRITSAKPPGFRQLRASAQLALAVVANRSFTSFSSASSLLTLGNSCR
jgi:hypothetical protein